jgi:hypothetical protein
MKIDWRLVLAIGAMLAVAGYLYSVDLGHGGL